MSHRVAQAGGFGCLHGLESTIDLAIGEQEIARSGERDGIVRARKRSAASTIPRDGAIVGSLMSTPEMNVSV